VGVLTFMTVTGLKHKEVLKEDFPPQKLKKSWPVFVHKGESAEWKMETIVAATNV
jgi:hypothetical protein